jgi:hypothetical protein
MSPGPTDWQGVFAYTVDRDTGEPDSYGWTISNWGGTQGKMFLKFDNGHLFASNEKGFLVENDTFFVSMMGAYIDEFDELIFVPLPEGKFDAATSTIDFTQKHSMGSELGICAAKEFLTAPGLYYLQSDLYVGAKIKLANTRVGSSAYVSADRVVPVRGKVGRAADVNGYPVSHR